MLLYVAFRVESGCVGGISVLSPHPPFVRLGYLSTAVARVGTSISEPEAEGPSLESGSHAQPDRWWSSLKWGQRLQSKLEFVLAPDQTMPLSVAPVSLYKGPWRKWTEGERKGESTHKQLARIPPCRHS